MMAAAWGTIAAMEPVWPIPGTSRRLLFRVFFFLVFGYLIYQLLLLFSPFLSALAGAATVVVLFHPLHVRIVRMVGRRETLAAGLSTFLIILLVVVPFLLLGWLAVRQAAGVMPQVKAWTAEIQRPGEPRIERLLPQTAVDVIRTADSALGKWGIDFRDLLSTGLESLGTFAAQTGKAALGNVLGIVINVIVIVLAVFFFLRDGARMIRSVVSLVPMEAMHKELVVRRMDETFGAVVRGSILTAATQGLLAGIGFTITGLDYAVVLGLATFVFAFIPFVGAAGIWGPATIWLFMAEKTWQPWFLLAWGVLVISLVDNLLKPLLIGGRAKIPTFLLFFGILGGLKIYGLLGVFIGPLVLGLLTAFVTIYREQYQSAAPAEAPAGDPRPPGATPASPI